jgi:hypothetical protein
MRCRLSLLTNSALVKRIQMRGGRGELQGLSQFSTAVHITWHRAQINFGDLPPYLTYGAEDRDPGSRAFFTPGTGISFFRISDLPNPGFREISKKILGTGLHHFDVDPNPNPIFTLMRSRIRLFTGSGSFFWLRCGAGSGLSNDADPDPQHCIMPSDLNFHIKNINTIHRCGFRSGTSLTFLKSDYETSVGDPWHFVADSKATGLWIRIRIGSVFNWVCGSGSVFGIRIRIQEGKNDPQK